MDKSLKYWPQTAIMLAMLALGSNARGQLPILPGIFVPVKGAAAAVNCGETSQTITDSGNADFPFGSPCVTGSDASGYTPASIKYWVGNPSSASFDLGIYADSSGSPGSLLCHTGTTTLTPTSGFNSISLSGDSCPTLSASTQYWVGYITGSNSIEQGVATGDCPGTSLASVFSTAVGSALLPNPFGTPIGGTNCYSMYMTLNPR
jgi:hypothetical protein